VPDLYVDDGTGAHDIMFARLGFDYTHGREADIPRDSEHSSGSSGGEMEGMKRKRAAYERFP
jgi:hypothetical protein